MKEKSFWDKCGLGRNSLTDRLNNTLRVFTDVKDNLENIVEEATSEIQHKTEQIETLKTEKTTLTKLVERAKNTISQIESIVNPE